MIEISMEELEKPKNTFNPFDNLYTKECELGQGAFGKVIKAIDNSTREEVAIKVLPKKRNNINIIMKEVNILKGLSHPNIVKFHNFFESDTSIYIVMEYLKGGTLKQYINQNKHTLNESTARVIIKQLLNAVKYLHSECDICHRDIKPDNIMLSNPDDITSLKLLDFGLSSDSFEQKSFLDNCGTLIYMAPEQIDNFTYSKSVDIWSIGIILYILLNKGHHPFHKAGDSNKEIIAKLKKAAIKYDKENYGNITPIAKCFIQKMLMKIPSYRYTAKLALEHPWITMKKYDDIPMNLYDKFREREYKKKMQILLLTALYMKQFDNEKKEDFDIEEYKRKTEEMNKEIKNKFYTERDNMFETDNQLKISNAKIEKEDINENLENKIPNSNNSIHKKILLIHLYNQNKVNSEKTTRRTSRLNTIGNNKIEQLKQIEIKNKRKSSAKDVCIDKRENGYIKIDCNRRKSGTKNTSLNKIIEMRRHNNIWINPINKNNVISKLKEIQNQNKSFMINSNNNVKIIKINNNRIHKQKVVLPKIINNVLFSVKNV